MKFNADHSYSDFMKSVPEHYKLRDYEPQSLTKMQILVCLKMFMAKDSQKSEGQISQKEIFEILQALGFRTSQREVEFFFYDTFFSDDYDLEKAKDQKINFPNFIRIVDQFKQEKLVLVQVEYYLNYAIFALFIIMITVYVKYFYSYKSI
jgi:hypothetical protein